MGSTDVRPPWRNSFTLDCCAGTYWLLVSWYMVCSSAAGPMR